MKVLIQWAGAFDTPGPANHLLKALIEDMVAAGISVHLIQGSIKRVREEVPVELRELDGFTCDTIKRRNIAKSSFVLRYLEELVYIVRSYRYWKRLRDVDIVFVRSFPTSVFAIVLAKRFFKKPVLYGIQDMWPGTAVNSGVLRNKTITKLFYALQKIAYKQSDFITVISEDMKKKVMEQGVEEHKIVPILNWFDDKSVKEVPWDENLFVRKYNLSKDKFYVQYAGTMGYVFDYKMVLAVAEILRERSDIEFHMIGQGSQKKMFMEEAHARGLSNILFFPLEPQEMVSHVYSACSVCLIPLKKGVIGNSVPSKAGLLMACRRAIVNSVDRDSDYYKMFEESKTGISVSNDDPQGVANAILELYKNRDKLDELARNGYEFARTKYARSVNTSKFIELFSHMVSTREMEE